MSAPAEKTVLRPDMKWLDGDSVDDEVMFSRGFDPKETAAKDASEIVSKYAQEIRDAVSK